MKIETIGKRLRRVRRELDITQKELAEKVGVTFGYISKYERDEALPSIKTLIKLSDVFHKSIDELLTGKTGLQTVKDHDLFKKFEDIQKLPKTEKEKVKTFIEGFLAR